MLTSENILPETFFAFVRFDVLPAENKQSKAGERAEILKRCCLGGGGGGGNFQSSLLRNFTDKNLLMIIFLAENNNRELFSGL